MITPAKGPGHLVQLLCLLLLSAPLQAPLHAAPSSRALDGQARLKTLVVDPSAIRLHPSTGLASFVRLDAGARPSQPAGQSFDVESREFLAVHGSAFGLHQPGRELQLLREQQDVHGRGFARYRQVYQGLPVFGSGLVSHFGRDRQLRAISATTVEIGQLTTQPQWAAGQARDMALQAVLQGLTSQSTTASLQVVHTELVIYHSGLLQGVAGRIHLAWLVEVGDGGSVRDWLLVDARTGKVLNQVSRIRSALDRKVSETSLGNVKWQDSSSDPDPIPPGWAGGSLAQTGAWQDEIDGARETYNLFASMTGGAWLSYDNQDATLRTINNNPAINCPNASWNGVSTNYCTNITGDDTVGHEWGHAYNEYTAGFIYQWQAGALDESFADVWGELVDLLNGRGTDSPLTLRTAGSCSVYGAGPDTDDSYRWLAMEDSSGFGGAIRDLWMPTCFGDPGKVSDAQYHCSSSDGGGVHSNSGVPNHAFALLVDGGTYNGQAINGLGLAKAAHLYWNALQMLLPASGFSQMADALEASCSSLVDVNLPQLSTSQVDAGLSGEVITAGDCGELAKVVHAVELRTPPTQCDFQSLLDNDPPPRCTGTTVLQSISLTDWEAGLSGWTTSRYGVANAATFDTADWAVVAGLPDQRPGSAAFVADQVIGDCQSDDESGALSLTSPNIQVPAGVSEARVSLTHWVASEFRWDGGNLKISVNGSAFSLVPQNALEASPYNTNLRTQGFGNTNPMAGQSAFSGSDQGSLVGSWGQTQVSLNGIAEGGDTFQLRLDFGLDGCNGLVGWYVDEVEVYSCSAAPQGPVFGDGFEDPP